MTIFLETPRTPSNATFAGGIASLGDIAGATRDSMLYVENSNGAFQSLDQAIEERRKAIYSATGTQLSNPLADAESEWRRLQTERPSSPLSASRLQGIEPESRDAIYNRHLDAFRAQLGDLSEKFPDAHEAIGATRDLWDDAAAIAREADERLGTLMASRSGLGKYGALLAGGMAGALADPITVMSLAAGGGPGAARTVAGRILTIAGKEALINAAAEGAIQPMVQAWRERAGLDHGMDEAIRNVLFAGAIGGAFGGVFGAAGEAASRFLRPADTERAVGAIATDARLSEQARAILANDGLRAADSLAEIRAALPAEARGALDAAEIMRLADERRPESASPAAHDAAIARADQAVRMPDAIEAWPGFSPDPAQIARVVRAIAGDAAPQPVRMETPLIDFLIERGGVRDFRGELGAIGAGGVSERFRGRLVRQDGETLDYAREAAAQAGFFDAKYGDPDTASARSTVADLLDVLEEEVRVRTGGPARAAEEAALGTLEGIVSDVARMAGPNVDDALITRAARMAVEDGLEPFDALERVFMSEDAPPALADRSGEPLPGWSDAELLAASEHRGAWPEPDGIDDPAKLTPEDVDWEAELTTARQRLNRFVIEERTADLKVLEDGAAVRAIAKEYLAQNADRIRARDIVLQEQAQWAYVLDGDGTIWKLRQAEHADFFKAMQADSDLADETLARAADVAIFRLGRNGQTIRGGLDFFATPTEKQARTLRQMTRALDGAEDAFSVSLWQPEAEARTTNADAARLRDDLAELPDDFMIPTDDGMVSAAQMRDDIARRENLAAVVEACRA